MDRLGFIYESHCYLFGEISVFLQKAFVNRILFKRDVYICFLLITTAVIHLFNLKISFCILQIAFSTFYTVNQFALFFSVTSSLSGQMHGFFFADETRWPPKPDGWYFGMSSRFHSTLPLSFWFKDVSCSQSTSLFHSDAEEAASFASLCVLHNNDFECGYVPEPKRKRASSGPDQKRWSYKDRSGEIVIIHVLSQAAFNMTWRIEMRMSREKCWKWE